MARAPIKVAILGGGMSGMTAAYYLSDPAQQGRYEVTVYQMGWRLGGKGASGRNRAVHDRIEEHGLHIWFGCYHNALAAMRQCYEELGRTSGPIRTMDEAFKGQDHLVLREHIDGAWPRWNFDFPPYPSWDEVPTVLGFLKRVIGWLHHIIGSALDGLGTTVDDAEKELGIAPDFLHRVEHWLERTAESASVEIMSLLDGLRVHLDGLDTDNRKVEHAALAALPGGFWLLARALWLVLGREVEDSALARRTWIMAYTGLLGMRGMIDDEIYAKGFDSIDHLELRDWLESHSMMRGVDDGLPDRLAIWSPNLQAFYDAAFSFLDGDPETPNLSAGIGLRSILRVLFDYRGHFVFEMQAGMGDVVFAPLYQAMKARGVRFEFFTRITDLGLDETGAAIGSVSVSRQITLKTGTYEPLFDVGGLPCWPNEPFFDQIEEGEALKASGADLSHWDSGWTDTGGTEVLEKGRHFDTVVLALSYGCLREVTPKLEAASPRWKAMTHGLNDVATQAWQIWCTRPRNGDVEGASPGEPTMGMPGPPAIIGAYVEPWSSLTDFSHLIPRESWPPASVRYLCYSCGVMKQPGTVGDDAVFDRMKSFMEADFKPLWPDAGLPDHPDSLDWSVLWAPEGTAGEDRLTHQYWRSNTDPTERYVMSSTGTTPARLKAAASGFDNLFLAGEWVDTGLNISSIETTVMAGMKASRAISGFPATIIGEVDT